jgi:hypothetical protein
MRKLLVRRMATALGATAIACAMSLSAISPASASASGRIFLSSYLECQTLGNSMAQQGKLTTFVCWEDKHWGWILDYS